MKQIVTLNQPLSEVIASMSHMDTFVVAEAGLPIPLQTQRIDLALERGTPGFFDSLRVILEDLQVERAFVAEELISTSTKIYEQLQNILTEIPIETISHTKYKYRTGLARAVVRTGEFTPYANIILVAGVIF